MKSNIPKTNTLLHQTGTLNRAFRLVYVTRDVTQEEKYIQGVYKSCWKYGYKYIDEPGIAFEVLEDWTGKKIVEKVV